MTFVALRSLAVCFLAALWASPAAAQAPLKKGRVEGKIVSTTGAIIRSAEVRLTPMDNRLQNSTGPTLRAFSDENGLFVFEEVDPTPILALAATKAGYSQARLGAKTPNGAVVPFPLKPGETVKDLVLIMTQQGVLSGRVLDEAGDPVQGAQVILLRRAFNNGVRSVGANNLVQTNDLGEFRFSALQTGRYYLVATVSRDFGQGVMAVPTYFPSATDFAGARALDLEPGEEKHNLDIRFQRAKGYTVRGKVLGTIPAAMTPQAGDRQPPFVAATVAAGAIPGMGARQARIGPDGTFELKQMTPGDYLLGLNGPLGGVRTPLRVGMGDMEGIVLTPATPFTITGKVVVSGGNPEAVLAVAAGTANDRGIATDAAGMRMILGPLGNPDANQQNATVNADGTFTFKNVLPGRYFLDRPSVAGVYIQGVKWGDKDVTHAPLEVTGDGTLEVTVRRTAATITGKVVDDQGRPPGSSFVALWPEVAYPSVIYGGVRLASVGRDGTFTLVAVAPGPYYAAALEEVNGSFAVIRELLTQFNEKAIKVEVKEDAPLSIAPPLVPVEKVQEALNKLP
jgi:hypothetical protein